MCDVEEGQGLSIVPDLFLCLESEVDGKNILRLVEPDISSEAVRDFRPDQHSRSDKEGNPISFIDAHTFRVYAHWWKELMPQTYEDWEKHSRKVFA